MAQRTVPQTRVPSAQVAQTRTPSGTTPAPASGSPITRVPSARPAANPASPSGAAPIARTAPAPVAGRTVPLAGTSTVPSRVPSQPVAGTPPSTTPRSGLATNPVQPRAGVQPVVRQPSGIASQVAAQQAGSPGTQTLPGVRTARAPTGADAQQAAASASRVAATRAPVPQRQATGSEGSASAPTPRTAVAAQTRSAAVARARRVSKVIVEKEKKTDYWQEIIEEARHDAPELNQDDVNAMIARCLSLNLVANWKSREENGEAPKAKELFQQLAIAMERALIERNGGPVHVDGTGFTRIKNMERQLQILESQADTAHEAEAEKVKAKITELTTSLQNIQHKKDAERETNRRTMTMELSNLREQMLKAAQEPATDQQKMIEENKKMAQKMARLESALRQMNDEKKKGGDDTQESAMLRKKLALFENRMKELEDEKNLRKSEEHSDAMKDKLLLMEEKLAKMERRKSVSITMMMQQKMQEVEQQLATLRQGGPGDASKVAALEKKLVEMQNTKVNPSMVNDPETRALRSQIKRMEEAMMSAEKKMEADRLRLEEEREQQVMKRQREEEAYRKKAQQREQLLLDKMAEMEKRIGQARGGPPPPPGAGGGGGFDPTMQKKLEEMEKRLNSGGALADKMAAMEARLREAESKLQSERDTSQQLLGILGTKEGAEKEAAEKDIKIFLLTQTTQDLMSRLEATQAAMDAKFDGLTKKIDTMQFTGGGGQAHVHKSGLSYADINAKLEEIQKKLFDPDIEERESEQLNIEYEKLISELEGTAEYKAEQEAVAKKWKEENTPLNNAALAKLKQEIASWTPMKKTAQFKRKPELKFLEFTPDQINKKHVNDFKGVTTQNLTLEEARALFACMPEFRKDQEAQLQFHEQLKNKIETEAKKPAVKAPPPIKATKQVVFKKPTGDGGSPDFLAELMKKRKQVG